MTTQIGSKTNTTGIINLKTYREQLRMGGMLLNDQQSSSIYHSIDYSFKDEGKLGVFLTNLKIMKVYQVETFTSLLDLTKSCIALLGDNFYKALDGTDTGLSCKIYYHASGDRYTFMLYKKRAVIF